MSLKKQPVYLNLMKIRFPVTALCSILHRITGILIFLSTPLLLWGLNQSLKSPAHFDHLKETLHHPVMKVVIWLALSAFVYHAIAGIRHLVMDMGMAESIQSARKTAFATLVLSVLAALGLGVWLC